MGGKVSLFGNLIVILISAQWVMGEHKEAITKPEFVSKFECLYFNLARVTLKRSHFVKKDKLKNGFC